VAKPPADAVVEALLERHGQTFAQELSIDVAQGDPLGAVPAAGRLHPVQRQDRCRSGGQGRSRPHRRGLDHRRKARRHLLEGAGAGAEPARLCPLRRAHRLHAGDACELLLDRYRGDLRRLRAEAGQDPKRERQLLKVVKGLGEVGVDIFFREAQVAWEELFPFVDRRAAQAARRLGLDADPEALAGDLDPEAFARLMAALVRTRLANDHDAVLEAARARSPT
jgi:hypothetical protein